MFAGGKGTWGGKAGGTGGKFDQEDRSRDWYCSNCGERNFMKRSECHKCGASKPKDGGAPPRMPENGTTLDGMVKSYNRKGFGFIMCTNGHPQCQDIYYSRENLHISLQTRDIPGEHVTFELQKFHDGKLIAKNVRPLGEPADIFNRTTQYAPQTFQKGVPKGGASRAQEEDRSHDWNCERCGERNFAKRFECFKCHTRRKPQIDDPAPAPRRTFSPHAGARAIREALAGARKRSRSGSSSSSSSSSEKKKKKKKRKKKRSSSSSSSSSKSRKSSKSKSKSPAAGKEKDEDEAPKNPEVEKAKAESLQKLVKLQQVEPLSARMKEYRELLRHWHPDKNPDKIEVATAVFQFLQKAKPMLDPK